MGTEYSGNASIIWVCIMGAFNKASINIGCTVLTAPSVDGQVGRARVGDIQQVRPATGGLNCRVAGRVRPIRRSCCTSLVASVPPPREDGLPSASNCFMSRTASPENDQD